MYLISINDIRPGQVVAKAVTNTKGAVLCPSGFKLTESAITRLKNTGVESIIVEGEAGGDVEQDMEKRLEELARRFESVEDPIMIQLRAAIEKRLRFMSF